MLDFYAGLEPTDPLALIHLMLGREITLDEERALRAAFKSKQTAPNKA